MKKLIITKNSLPTAYCNYTLEKSKDGLSQNVYFLGERFVLKVAKENEIKIYNQLLKYNLKVPKVVDSFEVDGFVVLVFEKIKGDYPNKNNLSQLREICGFAKRLHSLNISIKKAPFQIKKSPKEIKLLVKELNITPKADTFIHGDLFVDNTKFIGNSLSGVFDFSDSGMGDKNFEYGAIALSWCNQNSKPNIKCIKEIFSWVDIDFLEFLDYIGYASLFYASKRFTLGVDYQDLIKFYKELRKIK